MPADEEGEKRWSAVALIMAQQTRACVDILACIEGECTKLGQVCPDETTGEREAK